MNTGIETDFIEYLLSVGVDPNIHPNDAALSPLCVVAGQWQTKPLELATLLLQNGARLEHSGALSAVAHNGRKDLVEVLLSEGADVNDIDSGTLSLHRWPALHAAVKKGHGDIAKVLLDAGANPDILDAHGKTAQQIAKIRDDREMVNLINECRRKQ